MKKTTLGIVIMSIIFMTGCSTTGGAGKDTSETTEYSAVIEQMESMGITGDAKETNEAESQYFAQSARLRGLDHYVSVTTDTGDVYLGAVIDGEVEIWNIDDYNSKKLEDISSYTGNVIIQILPADGYVGDIDVTLCNNADGTTTRYTAKEADNYILDLTLESGTWSIFDYSMPNGQGDTYYIELTSFNVGSDQIVEQILMGII